MNETTHYQRTIDVILNRAKDFYRNYKERLRDKYRNLSEEEKNKNIEYGRNRYHNMSEKKEAKAKRIYKKNYREVNKSRKSFRFADLFPYLSMRCLSSII